VSAETLHGICVAGVLFELFRRDEARPGALGGKWAGGDGVEANIVLAHSTASEVVIARTPALAHEDGTTNPEPQFAAA